MNHRQSRRQRPRPGPVRQLGTKLQPEARRSRPGPARADGADAGLFYAAARAFGSGVALNVVEDFAVVLDEAFEAQDLGLQVRRPGNLVAQLDGEQRFC